MNHLTTLMTEEATKYLTEAILKTFPNINFMSITANGIKMCTQFSQTKNSFAYDEISTTLLNSCTD
jgi:short-subunit dehydrogenase involved in D-alanine esterification of teichoic acids